ncbi:MAG: hypothetical protein NWE76_01150 [Candidatus Bathyarchaeota archaeon]|nr:hypothetical protein [Candidatus Bathyarchaeota archaeon]
MSVPIVPVDVREMEPEGRRDNEVGQVTVLVLSHCILNRATRWWKNGRSIEMNSGPVGEVLGFLSARRIGAIQMPCPEFTFLGNPRPPATKDEYAALPGFQRHCESLARDVAQGLKASDTLSRKPKIKILGIVGVRRSPSCSVECAPRRIGDSTRYLKEKGLFLEILEKELARLDLRVPFVEVDLDRPERFCQSLDELLGSVEDEDGLFLR